MSMPGRLRILYHHRTQGRGAEGVHIASIVKALQALGHEVTVVSPPGIDPLAHAGNAPVDKSAVEGGGIAILWKLVSRHLPNFLFEFAEIAYNLPALRRLERELSRTRYDLVYERYAFYLVAGAIKARRHGIPLVLEANEVNGVKDRARRQTMPWLCDRFERFLFRRCHAIHTVSSRLRQMILEQGVAGERVRVTPNAVDPEKFSQRPEVADLRHDWGLEDRLVLGFAGWFDHWDRLDLLIEVFARLAARDERLALLLIGDGEVLATVRTKIAQLKLEDRVKLTGAVDRAEVHRYLSLLDIAVITHSNAFGSPVVMFEFMGLQVPIVAPRLPPIIDVLVDRQDALLFDVLDMEGLENSLRELIDDPAQRRQIAGNAYGKLLSEHTWRNNAELILQDAMKTD